MIYGVLGDIHSNLAALQAALSVLRSAGADQILSVGDVVGYGAAPRECIALLKDEGVHVVKGNHDAAVAGELDPRYFNQYARAAVEWTQRQLTAEEMHWLAGLPLRMHFEHCALAHGSYAHPEDFHYVHGPHDADASLDELELPVCFVGHTHVPVTLLRLAEDPLHTAFTHDSFVDLSETTRAVVNVGSVGQPRDEDPRAACALYDSSARLLRIVRTSYDIEREQARILKAGLPPVLAERLSLGV